MAKPEKRYIGSAKNIKKRWWNHLYFLRKNEHHSVILQRHYNKYGDSDLQFSVLLCCDKNDLIRMEQYFIDLYNPCFNVKKIAGRTGGMIGRKHSKATRLKQSISHKGCKAWNKGTKGLMVSWNRTAICQFDMEGNYIQEWESAYKVEKVLGIKRTNIGLCAKGKAGSAGGFVWKYKLAS